MLEKPNWDFYCEDCLLAKAKKRINHKTSENEYDCFLELVQSDIFGPVQTPSFSNKRYFITFLDKATKDLEAMALNKRSEAFDKFQAYITKHERQSDKKLINYRTDNALEFQPIEQYCKKHGINHQKTGSYAHEQAGTAERINLVLLDKTRALLFVKV